MTRLDKAREAVRLLDEAESAMIAREIENIKRLFLAKRKMLEWELRDAESSNG